MQDARGTPFNHLGHTTQLLCGQGALTIGWDSERSLVAFYDKLSAAVGLFFSLTPGTRTGLGGYIGTTLGTTLSVCPSVCLFVCLSVCPASCREQNFLTVAPRIIKLGMWMHHRKAMCRVPNLGHCDLDFDL